MPKEPFVVTKGFQHPKTREKRAEVYLAADVPTGLPRIESAEEAWVGDQSTLEVELRTVDGRRVIVPLTPRAVLSLHELLEQALKLQEPEAGP